MVTLIPDSGRAYLSKFYDDNYMLEHGLLERGSTPPPTVGEVLRHQRASATTAARAGGDRDPPRVGDAIALMQRYSISQLPVVRRDPAELDDVVGSLHERGLLDRVFKDPDALEQEVAEAMQPPLHVVDAGESIDRVFADLTGGSPAVVVADGGRPGGRADPLRPARVSGRPTGARRSMISVNALRRHVIAAQGYAGRRLNSNADDVEATIRRLGAVQLDSISTVDRSHRLTLGARIGVYPKGTISKLLGEGRVFEYWAHEACLMTTDNWPMWKRRMDEFRDPPVARGGDRQGSASWPTRCSVRSASAGRWARAISRARDPAGCGTRKPAKIMLEALWSSGDLAIAGRQGFQRLYDLSERVIPAAYLEAPIPTETEFLRAVTLWAVTTRGALTERRGVSSMRG